MSFEILAAQEALSRIRGQAVVRPHDVNLHVAELEHTVRLLRLENRDLKRRINAAEIDRRETRRARR